MYFPFLSFFVINESKNSQIVGNIFNIFLSNTLYSLFLEILDISLEIGMVSLIRTAQKNSGFLFHS